MKPNYIADGDSFVIEHYNEAPPFSNFFPALAGVTGKPLWVFYTNRGQGIASFGINSKDGSMLEFLPANKAYQATPILGFRTFVKIGSDVHEPFAPGAKGRHQSMIVRPYELEVRERDPETGLETSALTFGVPGESHPVLARRLSIKNNGKRAVTLTVVDGLPRIVPMGMGDYLVKNMSRTIEAFAEVVNFVGRVPFFKLKIEPHDRPDIKWLEAGFFSFAPNDGEFLPVVVDPSAVFGADTAFLKPLALLESNSLSSRRQLTSNIMPSSLFYSTITLKPKEVRHWDSLYGHAPNRTDADTYAASVRKNTTYFDTKRDEMKAVYRDVVGNFGLMTGDERLNQYGAVTFMDNVLRGGYPMSFGSKGPVVHVFSRKHGDMERDYNAFQVSATYYSQGNGNFRDVNQNRRNDLFVNPALGTANLDLFFNLLQLDGYNPLVINPTRFVIPKDVLNRIELRNSDSSKADYQAITGQPVMAGQLYEFLKKHSDDPLNVNNQFREVLSAATVQHSVQHGEGFWSDHWTYNLDHIEQYLAVFPEKMTWLLYEKEDYTFFDSDHFVRPRREKYVVTPQGKLRQYNAVAHSPQKHELISSRTSEAHKVRIEAGMGAILQVSFFTKLIALASVKLSSLDPFGVGIEMDADKPGWCDALNGLPGLFGSSSHETFELHRLFLFLKNQAIPAAPAKSVELPWELGNLIRDVDAALEKNEGKDFRPTWDKLATAREVFRDKTFMGVSGKTKTVRIEDLRKYVERAIDVLEKAQAKAMDPATGFPTSYFTYDVDAAELGDGWRQFLSKLPWQQHRVAPFLEGVVHAMKLASPVHARRLYQAVRRSKLRDNELGMYRLNAPLLEESSELGRIGVFSPGWLENESIFLHMHYKYLLEILKSGMMDVFLKEIETGFIPFQDPARYGRSIFENSSFIASSAFPDKSFHGRGFVARLSGATSEFLSMSYFMMFGPRFFHVAAQGQLLFVPDPRLPGSWFTKSTDDAASTNNAVSLKIFGVPVTYVNPRRKNTFGPGAVRPVEFEWILDGRFYRHRGKALTPEASVALREGRLEQLTVTLG